MRLRVTAAAVVVLVALTGCTNTPAPPPVTSSSPIPTLTAAPTPEPIEGLPEDHTISEINAHVPAGVWAFIQTDSGDPVGVRINNVWRGAAGSLADRSYSQPAGQSPVDVTAAVPYFLSWSYVILDGTTEVPPAAIVLPSDTANVYNVESVFTDHDCPDYQPPVSEDVGFLVTHCAVSLALNDAYPIGLAFAVPESTQKYWFLDAPEPIDEPA